MNDIHYLTEKDTLIPVGQTPFAKDAHFGYSQSNLKEWILEKTEKKWLAGQLFAIIVINYYYYWFYY